MCVPSSTTRVLISANEEQTIALDTVHALKGRVRVARREKFALREEILRIRAERDEVALKTDAVRVKHEVESKAAQVSSGTPF